MKKVGAQILDIHFEERLNDEYRRRTSVGVLPGILVVSITWAVFFGDIDSAVWRFAGLVIVASLFIRALLDQFLFQEQGSKVAYFKLIKIISVLTSIGWGTACFSVIFEKGLLSIESLTVMMVNVANSSAISYAMAPIGWLRRTYLLCALLPISLAVFIGESNWQFLMYGVITIVFIIYLLSISGKQKSSLISNYRLNEEILAQREKLQKIIDSLSGFVAVYDLHGNCLDQSLSFVKFMSNPEVHRARNDFADSGLSEKTVQIVWLDNGEKQNYVLSFARSASGGGLIIISGIPANDLAKAQEQIESERAKAIYNSRLATMGEMASGVAHEINNPLVIILGNLDYALSELSKRLPSEDRSLGRISASMKAAERISGIVRSLRTYSSNDEYDWSQQFELAGVIDGIVNLCQSRFLDQGVSLNISEVPKVSLIGNQSAMLQGLVNLLNNAFAFALNSKRKEVSINMTFDGSLLRLAILDNGTGVPEEIKEKIFEPFFTTKDIGHGVGLSLTVSRNIFNKFGGNLVLKSPRAPTEFEITLPAVQKSLL